MEQRTHPGILDGVVLVRTLKWIFIFIVLVLIYEHAAGTGKKTRFTQKYTWPSDHFRLFAPLQEKREENILTTAEEI